MAVPTWEQTQAAIQAWIVAGSGLAADRVRWSGQGGNIPTGVPWISITVLADQPTGSPWVDVEDATSPTAGAEIVHVARSQHAGTLSIQMFNAAAVGSSSGIAVLRRLRAAARLPTVRAALEAGGVGLGSFTAARNVPALQNATYFEPRGVIECRIHTVCEIRPDDGGEAGTYIETVEIEGAVDP